MDLSAGIAIFLGVSAFRGEIIADQIYPAGMVRTAEEYNWRTLFAPRLRGRPVLEAIAVLMTHPAVWLLEILECHLYHAVTYRQICINYSRRNAVRVSLLLSEDTKLTRSSAQPKIIAKVGFLYFFLSSAIEIASFMLSLGSSPVLHPIPSSVQVAFSSAHNSAPGRDANPDVTLIKDRLPITITVIIIDKHPNNFFNMVITHSQSIIGKPNAFYPILISQQ